MSSPVSSPVTRPASSPVTRPASRTRGERGAAAVLAVALAVLLVALTGVVTVLGGLLVAHRKAAAAADLAALAGAAALQRGADPCAAAEEVTTANGARMAGCQVHGEDVRVAATREVALPGGTVRVPGNARAGPEPAGVAGRGGVRDEKLREPTTAGPHRSG